MNIPLNFVFFFVLGVVTCVLAGISYLWSSDPSVISLFWSLLNASVGNQQ